MSQEAKVLFEVNLLGGLNCKPEFVTTRRGRELLALLVLAEYVPTGHSKDGVLRDWLAQWYASGTYHSNRERALNTLGTQLTSSDDSLSALIEKGTRFAVRFRENVMVSVDIKSIFGAYEDGKRDYKTILSTHGGKLLLENEDYFWFQEPWYVDFYASLTRIYLHTLWYLAGKYTYIAGGKNFAVVTDERGLQARNDAFALLEKAQHYLEIIPDNVAKHV